MALTAAQIVQLATQAVQVPGMSGQAGAFLNAILSDLCQTYDFDIIRETTTFNFDVATGSGPYSLPADYLRVRPNEFWYTITGVKYVMISIDLAEFDALVQQAGLQSYPTYFATSMADTPEEQPKLYVWPPPSGAYPCTMRYQKQMPDITNPETSDDAPWFPNSQYLLRRLEAELCTLVDDDRQPLYVKQAEDILRNYLEMKDDKLGRAQQVQLDRRYFNNNFSRIPNTKTIGW